PALTGITGQGPLPRARLRLCFPVSPLYRCAAPYRHEKPGQLTAVARRGATGLCETLRPSGSGAPRRLGGVPGECPIFGLVRIEKPAICRRAVAVPMKVISAASASLRVGSRRAGARRCGIIALYPAMPEMHAN